MDGKESEFEAEQIMRIYKEAMMYYENFCACFKQLGKGGVNTIVIGYAKTIARLKDAGQQLATQTQTRAEVTHLKNALHEQGAELAKLRTVLSTKQQSLAQLEAERGKSREQILELQRQVQTLERQAISDKPREQPSDLPPDKHKADKNYEEEYFAPKLDDTLDLAIVPAKRQRPEPETVRPEPTQDSLSTFLHLVEQETKDLRQSTARTLLEITAFNAKASQGPQGPQAQNKEEAKKEAGNNAKTPGEREDPMKDADYVLELFDQTMEKAKEQDFFGLSIEKSSGTVSTGSNPKFADKSGKLTTSALNSAIEKSQRFVCRECHKVMPKRSFVVHRGS